MAKSSDTQENGKTKAKTGKKSIEIETKDNAKSEAETPGKGDDLNGQRNGGDKSANNGQDGADNEQMEALIAAEKDLAAEKDKYLRLAAEYDNFRKRTAKERDSIYSNAKADVIGKLLPVYDNLERALKLECSDEAYFKGIEMTMQQLAETLKALGVEPIPTVGEPFDPNCHDAVARVEDKSLGAGIIAEECLKGFKIGERIIRHSSVVVAN